MNALFLVNCLENDESCENRQTLLKCGFMTGYLTIGFMLKMI